MTIDDVTVLDRGKENLEYSNVPLLEKSPSMEAMFYWQASCKRASRSCSPQ
jgi:hypothetical protein